MDQIGIAIVDDHQVLIDGLCSMLESVENMAVLGTASNGPDALALARNKSPDVFLLDINMPGMDGIETCRRLLEAHPDLKIIALTMHDDYTYIEQMLEKGAHGYLLKHSGKDEIVLAIRQVYQNKSYYSSDVTQTLVDGMRRKAKPAGGSRIKLTNREREVLGLIVDGLTSPEIAQKLHIGLSTAETHRKNLLRKLDVHNSAGLVREAIAHKLVDR